MATITQKFITRQEIADDLNLNRTLISEAIAVGIIPVDSHMGMVPRVWYKGAKLNSARVYEELVTVKSKAATNLSIASAIIGAVIGAAFVAAL